MWFNIYRNIIPNLLLIKYMWWFKFFFYWNRNLIFQSYFHVSKKYFHIWKYIVEHRSNSKNQTLKVHMLISLLKRYMNNLSSNMLKNFYYSSLRCEISSPLLRFNFKSLNLLTKNLKFKSYEGNKNNIYI